MMTVVHAWLCQRAGYARHALGTPTAGRASHHYSHSVASGYGRRAACSSAIAKYVTSHGFHDTASVALHHRASAGANQSLCPPCLLRTPLDFIHTYDALTDAFWRINK